MKLRSISLADDLLVEMSAETLPVAPRKAVVGGRLQARSAAMPSKMGVQPCTRSARGRPLMRVCDRVSDGAESGTSAAADRQPDARRVFDRRCGDRPLLHPLFRSEVCCHVVRRHGSTRPKSIIAVTLNAWLQRCQMRSVSGCIASAEEGTSSMEDTRLLDERLIVLTSSRQVVPGSPNLIEFRRSFSG